MTKPAFWFALASVGALIACDTPDPGGSDTGDTTSASETTDDGPPSGDADVEIINSSGYTFYYVWQCDDAGSCYDALGSSVLNNGESLLISLESGDWYTIIVDEDDYCSTSGLYTVASGEYYSWQVTESDLYGSWDGSTCY